MNISRLLHAAIRGARKAAPAILAVGGGVLVVAGVVGTAKASTSVADIVEEHKEAKKEIEERVEKEETYSDKEYRQDVSSLYFKTGVKLAKKYAVPFGSVALGIGMMGYSNKLLADRAKEAVAYAGTVYSAFGKYRERVIADQGTDKDRQYRLGETEKKIAQVYPDGTINELTQKTFDISPEYSCYARVYDDGNAGWSKDPMESRQYLLQLQDSLSYRLLKTGFVSINEVYAILKYPRVKNGNSIGWKYIPGTPNRVDFGIYNVNNPANVAYINGLETNIVLEFNVNAFI